MNAARPATVSAIGRCSCGCATRHQVARRLTADGIAVIMSSDGSITGRFGALSGVTCVRPRTMAAHDAAIRAGWMLISEVEMYDLCEVADLYAACRWAAERELDRAAMIAHLSDDARPMIRWTITERDARGNMVEREGVLNRIQWPGVVILHNARGYAVLTRHFRAANCNRGADVLMPTGFVFRTQRELYAHLSEIKQGTAA